MSRYWDRPMDFADVSLVYLAKREAVSIVLTVDHTGFETYRFDGRRRFRVLPANRPQKYGALPGPIADIFVQVEDETPGRRT